MQNVNRKAYLDAQHRILIKNEEIPVPGPHEVVVKIEANGICGSDIHFFKEGRLGNFVVTVPYVPGHECSGTIAYVGSEVKGFAPGNLVTIEPGIPCGRCEICKSGRYNLCKDVVFLSAPPINGTFCDYVCLPAHMVFHIPKKISFEEAAMIEPVAVAVHAVNRARFSKGCTGLIAGAGPIGLLTMQAFKAAGGGKVICTDINENRLEFAKKLGADEVANPVKDSADLVNSAEVVFETAGSDAATASLFQYACPGGCVVQVGWPHSNVVGMNIANFIEKELDYVSVNRDANAYPAAIQWVCDGRINVKDIITDKFVFEDIEKAFTYTSNNPDKVIKTVVTQGR
jgi:L-iditol 2-dehydrogenase